MVGDGLEHRADEPDRERRATRAARARRGRCRRPPGTAARAAPRSSACAWKKTKKLPLLAAPLARQRAAQLRGSACLPPRRPASPTRIRQTTERERRRDRRRAGDARARPRRAPRRGARSRRGLRPSRRRRPSPCPCAAAEPERRAGARPSAPSRAGAAPTSSSREHDLRVAEPARAEARLAEGEVEVPRADEPLVVAERAHLVERAARKRSRQRRSVSA